MHLLLSLLFLEIAGLPVSTEMPKVIESVDAIVGDAACANPSNDDMRPFTVCLAETWFDEADLEMGRQLKLTLAHLKASRGVRAADRLADKQRKWTKRRDRECGKEMARSPETQIARNTLGCRAEWTEQRTAQLKALVAK